MKALKDELVDVSVVLLRTSSPSFKLVFSKLVKELIEFLVLVGAF